jgi:tetratricopeptide (TPR) repeat protein
MRKFVLAIICAFLCGGSVLAQSPADEFNFYASQFTPIDNDKELLNTLSDSLAVWLAKNPDASLADDALFLKTSVLERLDQKPQARLSALKYAFEFPSGKKIEDMKKKISALSNGEEKAKRRAYLAEAQSSKPETQADIRLSNFLAKATALNLKNGYKPLLKEYMEFFVRFPVFKDTDKIELMLGDLHRANGNYEAAIFQYVKVYRIYLDSKYRAASLRMVGDVYAAMSGKYAQSAEYYNKALREFPDSPETALILEHITALCQNNKKYEDAAAHASRAAETYLKDGKKSDALRLLRVKAAIEETNLADPAESLKTLNKASKIFADDGEAYVGIQFEKARINGVKLKDLSGELQDYQQIAAAYPESPRAPQALYKAGLIQERLGFTEDAKISYKNLISYDPAGHYAAKAQKRLDKIERVEFKQLKKALKDTGRTLEDYAPRPARFATESDLARQRSSGSDAMTFDEYSKRISNR